MPLGGIRTHNLSRRAAADLRLRPRRQWDSRCNAYRIEIHIYLVFCVWRYALRARPQHWFKGTSDFCRWLSPKKWEYNFVCCGQVQLLFTAARFNPLTGNKCADYVTVRIQSVFIMPKITVTCFGCTETAIIRTYVSEMKKKKERKLHRCRFTSKSKKKKNLLPVRPSYMKYSSSWRWKAFFFAIYRSTSFWTLALIILKYSVRTIQWTPRLQYKGQAVHCIVLW